MRKRLEELAGGRPNDATRWNADNPNAAHIYRILLHLEWAEAHPQSLGFQPPEALEALRHVQPAVRAAADDDVVIEEQQAAVPDVIDLDEFVSLESHLAQLLQDVGVVITGVVIKQEVEGGGEGGGGGAGRHPARATALCTP